MKSDIRKRIGTSSSIRNMVKKLSGDLIECESFVFRLSDVHGIYHEPASVDEEEEDSYPESTVVYFGGYCCTVIDKNAKLFSYLKEQLGAVKVENIQPGGISP